MSRSDDPSNYFQPTEVLQSTERKAAKSKNKHGSPIKLPSKILAAATRSLPGNDNAIYVAEAAGEIKSVNLESGKIERIFSPGTGPLTCLAILPETKTLFTGSWDKNIYAVDLTNPKSPPKKLQSHTDFVKCLLIAYLPTPVLISGSADATIILWDIATGKPLHKLKGHTKALQNLQIDPTDPNILFSASSDREIRKWHISLSSASEVQSEDPILAHETSIYKITFDSDGDLWTASADKTAKHLVRTRNWEADTTLPNPDFVRDVLPFENLGVVVTACRDEEVRVWEISSGKLLCTYSGHYEEVTGLLSTSDGKGVISVSIDGTVRKWGLDKASMTKYEEDVAKEKSGEAETLEREKTGANLLTAEEEAELAELMGSDDDY